MGDHKEVLYERRYVQVPGTDKLRKAAAARLKHLLANGYWESERTQAPDSIVVHVERTGVAPLKARLPRQEAPDQRYERRPRDPKLGRPRGGPDPAPRATAAKPNLRRPRGRPAPLTHSNAPSHKEKGPPKRALSVC